MKIDVNIGELTLHGVPAEQRHRIGDGVKAELARMLAERPQAVPRRDREGAAVTRIASAIYREIRREIRPEIRNELRRSS